MKPPSAIAERVLGDLTSTLAGLASEAEQLEYAQIMAVACFAYVRANLGESYCDGFLKAARQGLDLPADTIEVPLTSKDMRH